MTAAACAAPPRGNISDVPCNTKFRFHLPLFVRVYGACACVRGTIKINRGKRYALTPGQDDKFRKHYRKFSISRLDVFIQGEAVCLHTGHPRRAVNTRIECS